MHAAESTVPPYPCYVPPSEGLSDKHRASACGLFHDMRRSAYDRSRNRPRMFLPESFLRFHAAADLLFFSILIAARYHDLLGAPDQNLYSRSIKVPTWSTKFFACET
jgi:hypothetical protein